MSLRTLAHRVERTYMRLRDGRERRSDDLVAKPPWRPRPIRTSVLLVVFVLILLGGWWYYYLQMAEIEALRTPGDAHADLEIAKMRLETVRATLTVAAGIGAASALVLSFRRQQHDEFHSTQQRITELRIQAVDQLSSEDPTVRIGGLYNLKRLGEQHEELRQLVLDEICAYLRRPFDAAASPPTDPEREVRNFAQDILQVRLKRKLGRRNYWKHDRLNLRGASLRLADFKGCRLRHADFTGARFRGTAGFDGASFEGLTWFTDVVFEGRAAFSRAVFNGQVDFQEAVFGGDADFERAAFNEPAWFERTTFRESLDCSMAEFRDQLEFTGATVMGTADFEGAVFDGFTLFSESSFEDNASFLLARFGGTVVFHEVEFRDHADFQTASFESWALFKRTTFHERADFERSTFKDLTVFRESAWKSGASFILTHFNATADFERAAFHGGVSLNGALFRSLLHDQTLPGGYRPVETSRGFRFLWTVKRDGSEPLIPRSRGARSASSASPGEPATSFG